MENRAHVVHIVCASASDRAEAYFCIDTEHGVCGRWLCSIRGEEGANGIRMRRFAMCGFGYRECDLIKFYSFTRRTAFAVWVLDKCKFLVVPCSASKAHQTVSKLCSSRF